MAVALATLAMHFLNCIHPPGGATALAMVISGQEVHALGYGAVLSPVGLNVVTLLVIALAVNNMFPGRRYPMLTPGAPKEKPSSSPSLTFGRMALSKEDIESAVKDFLKARGCAPGPPTLFRTAARIHPAYPGDDRE